MAEIIFESMNDNHVEYAAKIALAEYDEEYGIMKMLHIR